MDANPFSVHGTVFVLLLSCGHSYLVTKGVKQATLTGKSWRHGLMVLMFMVAGVMSRRQPDSTEPLDLGKKRTRQASPQGRSQRPRRRASALSSNLATGGSTSSLSAPHCSSGSSSCASSDASENAATIRSDDAYSDAGTDNTMSAGEEAEDAAPVPELVTTSAEYTAVFGSKPTHDAVLEVVCRAAAIMAKLCGYNKEEGYRMTEADAKALSEEAFEFVTKYVVALFGAVHTTKFHALAYHLLAELLLRGNVVEADTSLNEALHKLVKNMWDHTSEQPASVLLQMLRAEQPLAHMTETDAFDFQQAGGGGRLEVGDCVVGDEADAGTSTLRSGAVAVAGNGKNVDDEVNDDENDYGCKPDASQGGPEHNVLRVFDELATTGAFDGVPDEAPSEHDEDIEVDDDLANTLGSLQARRRVRISGRRVTVAQAAAADDARLQQLPNLLKSHPVASGCSAASQLIVANTFKFEARLEWRARPVRQLLRATNDLYRKPWWDYVLYEAPGARAGAKPHLGLARLLLHAVDGRCCDIVVVQRLEDADARPGCVLTSLNCRRKRWVINHDTGFPELSLVPLANVLRLEHVVPDFEDLAERWGMTATPTTVPDSPQEREEQRLFTNAFFPWTSNSVTEGP